DLAGHEVTVQLSPSLPLVKIDFVLMQQALTNLLLNVVVHTPPGTPAEIITRVEADHLLLTIADRGPGLPPEAVPLILDKFYRAPSAPGGGTGLGLVIVKGVVEAQGGRIRAQNRPGGGAAFTLDLPLSKPPPIMSEKDP